MRITRLFVLLALAALLAPRIEASRTSVWGSNPPASLTATTTDAAGLLASLAPAADADAEPTAPPLFNLGDVVLADTADADAEHFGLGPLTLVDLNLLRGPPPSYPETRVGGFELLPPFRAGASPTLSLWGRQACGFSCREVTSDSRYDPWGLCSGCGPTMMMQTSSPYIMNTLHDMDTTVREVEAAVDRSVTFAKAEAKGFVKAPVKLVKGVAHAVVHPVNTAKGIAQVARHPIQTAQAAGRAFADASIEQQGEMAGDILFGVFVGGATKTAEASALANELQGAGASEKLVHLTTPEAAAAIKESGRLGGRFGIFALEADRIPVSALGKAIKTLVPGELSASVEITGEAVAAFKKPPAFGLFSAARRLAGVRSSPLGSVDLAAGRFVAGEVFENGVFRAATTADKARYAIHQGILDYGVDSLIYTGAALHGASTEAGNE